MAQIVALKASLNKGLSDEFKIAVSLYYPCTSTPNRKSLALYDQALLAAASSRERAARASERAAQRAASGAASRERASGAASRERAAAAGLTSGEGSFNISIRQEISDKHTHLDTQYI
jgi:hypothetical protein